MGEARRYLINLVQRASMAVELKSPVTIEDMEPRGSGKEKRSPVRSGQVRHAQNPDIPAEAFSVTRRYIGTIPRDGNMSNALAAVPLEMRSPLGATSSLCAHLELKA